MRGCSDHLPWDKNFPRELYYRAIRHGKAYYYLKSERSRPKTTKECPDKIVERICLKCEASFEAMGKYRRVCDTCTEVNKEYSVI